MNLVLTVELSAAEAVSHGARPIHLITTMIKWVRTSRLSIKNSLSAGTCDVNLVLTVELSAAEADGLTLDAKEYHESK